MLTLILTLLSFFSIAFFIFKFLTTDGDFTLISKSQTKREEIESKVVWITGASRGIGEALAKQCASLGAKLIISARNEVELQRVKKELTDGKNPASMTKMYFMLMMALLSLQKSPALDVSDEGLKAAFSINVFGTITLTRLLVPSMLKRGRGHLVVMSSVAGKTPAPGHAVYSATKFALNGYFHTLRSELFGKGLKVTVICPGPIDTSGCASSEKRVSAKRCAELTIVAATHGLKEAWISYQPALGVMYLAQYMPTMCYLLVDKIGGKRLEAAADKRDTYSLSSIILGKKKAA